MAKNNQPDSASHNLIAQGTTIEGDIRSNGDIRIDGSLTGTISTKGKVVVGPTGIINGNVTCENAMIEGAINGTITVHELLSLKATSKLQGDIITNKLAIEPGSEFSGSCSMGAVVKDIKNADRTEAQYSEKTA